MSGLNSDTKLLLHCDGTDGATSFPDESDSNHTVTANGNAQVDTAEKKWGTGSALLDGTGDSLSITDSDDFNIVANGTDSYTLDLWLRANEDPTSKIYIFCGHGTDAQNFALQLWYVGNTFRFVSRVSNVAKNDCEGNAGFSGQGVWHHLALIKIATVLGLYLNGNQIGYSTINAYLESSQDLYFGQRNVSGTEYYFKGSKDEIRIQKSNYFEATPNVGLTDTITVPTEAYSLEAGIYVPNQSIIIM